MTKTANPINMAKNPVSTKWTMSCILSANSMQSLTPQTLDFVVLTKCFRMKDLLAGRGRFKPHEFLLECAQPTGGIVGRFSTSLRGPGLFD